MTQSLQHAGAPRSIGILPEDVEQYLQQPIAVLDENAKKEDLPLEAALTYALTMSRKLSSQLFDDLEEFGYYSREPRSKEGLQKRVQLRQAQINNLHEIADRALAAAEQIKEDLGQHSSKSRDLQANGLVLNKRIQEERAHVTENLGGFFPLLTKMAREQQEQLNAKTAEEEGYVYITPPPDLGVVARITGYLSSFLPFS